MTQNPTAEKIAAKVLADCKRYGLTEIGPVDGGQWIHYADARDAIAAHVADMRQSRQAMHRRAQKAEGKMQRSAALLETIMLSIKEVIPSLPTLPSPYPLSLHNLYHRVRAARDHARASSGRAFIEGWYYWSPKVEKLEAENKGMRAQLARMEGAHQHAMEACRIIDEVVKEGHDNTGKMILHFLTAVQPARAALTDRAADGN